MIANGCAYVDFNIKNKKDGEQSLSFNEGRGHTLSYNLMSGNSAIT